ncbi:MAG TPA: membrane protein insertase YidC [Caulobacteraceae bacterium]|jgi:YidC/Oxa1 family membrane protein insertase|nr:membrane protein insertase YidC [Caulobacteraceae bacterium]
MDNENSRNTILFVICAVAILLLYQVFVLDPATKRHQAEARAQAAAQATQHPGALPGAPPAGFAPVAQAAAASPRVKLDTPSLTGSINLRGARIDDLFLKRYREKIDPNSPMHELFRPEGAEHAWFAEFNWAGANVPGLPNGDTLWTTRPGATLTPQTPLVLTYANGAGLTFTRTISVDDDYMFTVSDKVNNASAQPVSIQPYASVQQRGMPNDLANSNIVHEGLIGMLAGKLVMKNYKDWKKAGLIDDDSSGGWLGITEKYWLSALIPDQGAAVKADFRVQPVAGLDAYQAGYVGAAQTVAPGATLSQTTRLFAGAKVVPLLRHYETSLNVPKFDQAVDWGNLWFLTQPMFSVLIFLKGYIGNIGLSILALTVIVKAIFFPLANQSYESISKMKKIQPQTDALKKQYEGDPTKLQQETMALYQREKINPLMGCLPQLIQIPVFYSLYKVLTVTIEMRHAPFYGWVHDLSARDPTSIWTLFNLIPWNPASLPLLGTYLDGPLHIGLWPLIYGFTMWLSQSMSPPAPDPTQQRIFQLMPILFTFTLSQFTVGLLIYWCWSNTLGILQQYVIMRRYKVDNPIDKFLSRFGGAKAATG